MIPIGQQNATHPGFVAKDRAYDCLKCMNHSARERGYPEMLDSEGLEAWNLYLMLQDQQRIGMDVIGLDYNCLPGVFDILGIPTRERMGLFERLVMINRAIQDRNAKKREQQALRDKARNQGPGGSGFRSGVA